MPWETIKIGTNRDDVPYNDANDRMLQRDSTINIVWDVELSCRSYITHQYVFSRYIYVDSIVIRVIWRQFNGPRCVGLDVVVVVVAVAIVVFLLLVLCIV